jgi:hypothetical protein
LNRINTAAAKYADNAANPAALGYVADGDYMMYCANAPLRSTGELGYLPVAPWRTLKLYQDPRDTRAGVQSMDPVLDYFTLSPTNTARFGLVNPNVKFDSHGMLLGPLLGLDNWADNECWRLYEDDESYDSFAPEMKDAHPIYTDNIFTRMRYARNQYLNISDVGRRVFHTRKLSDFKSNSDVLRYNELRFEDPMRRHSALAHVGGQVYTVLLWGQALGEGQGTDWDSYPVLSEAQAVAMVWRDPYPNERGEHRKFVRFMRWFE